MSILFSCGMNGSKYKAFKTLCRDCLCFLLKGLQKENMTLQSDLYSQRGFTLLSAPPSRRFILCDSLGMGVLSKL